MSFVVFRAEKEPCAITARNYGAGVIEAADERLKEEIATRSHVRAPEQPKSLEHRVRGELEKTNRELTKARRRRKALEAELKEARKAESELEQKQGKIIGRIKNIRKSMKEKTERERRRQAAMVRKQDERGAKPAGIRKTIPSKPVSTVNFSGFRLPRARDL